MAGKRTPSALVIALLFGFLPSTGFGQSTEEPLAAGAGEDADPPDSKRAAKAKKAKRKRAPSESPLRPGGPRYAPSAVPSLSAGLAGAGKVTAGGRLFVRAARMRESFSATSPTGVPVTERVDAFDLSIPTARAELSYRSPARWLTAELELELTDRPELKDAWIRARSRHVTAKLGQFKVPFSAVEMTSRFALPRADRGFLHELLVDELQIAGRRPGFTLEARTQGGVSPSLTLGAFQGSVLVEKDGDDRDVDPLFEQTLNAQSFVARAEIELGDFDVAAAYEHRIGTPAVNHIEHYFTLGGDVTLDTQIAGRGLRIWLEGMVGGSWFEHPRKPADGSDAVFSAGRLIVAPRIGGSMPLEPYLEPYGMIGLLDPDLDVSQDLAFEQAFGVNVGAWRLARVGLEIQAERVERNFPTAYGVARNHARHAVLLQAAAEF